VPAVLLADPRQPDVVARAREDARRKVVSLPLDASTIEDVLTALITGGA
jgi:hypothetical protein